MFQSPGDLLQSSLDLLRLAKARELSATERAALELGAATLANHVFDWHYEAHAVGPKGARPTPREWRSATASFAAEFPAWDLLRQVSNGLKHANPIIADPTNTEHRRPKWEDYDFWSAEYGGPTLFVEIDGRQRSIRALVKQFARSYVAAYPQSGVSTSPGGVAASSA